MLDDDISMGKDDLTVCGDIFPCVQLVNIEAKSYEVISIIISTNIGEKVMKKQ